MKKLFSRVSLVGLMALMCGMFYGCNPEGEKSAFSVSVKEAGPEYVLVQVSAPASVDVAYMLDTKEKRVDNPVMIFASGETLTVKPDDVIRISKGLEEDTQYYLYAVAKLDAQNYSEIITLPFKTTVYDLDELITVVDQSYDGFKVRITVPEETKKRGNAIRYVQSDIMMYNYMGQDDYRSLLYNGGAYTKFVTDDETIVYSEDTNWYQTGEDADGDGEIDWDTNYNPISPGEPIVYTAGEFSWMNGDEDALLDDKGNEIFGFPGGWNPGYFMPLLDPSYYTGNSGKSQSSMGIITDYEITSPMDSYWTGAFQRKHFFVKQPQPFDGKVDVKLVDASPIDLVLEFYPDKNVKQYAIGVFDDNMLEEIMKLCNNREDYLQWAITSYFAAYTFGTRVAKEAVQMKLTSFYYQDAIGENTDYHVLVTAMGDNMATIQNFQRYKFTTTSKVKDAPEILVTALQDESTPYVAKFNVKCTTAAEGNPVTECYYAANYKRDWLLEINAGATYFSIVAGNKIVPGCIFTTEMLEAVNSPEGCEIAIPSIDGEVTRLAVLGYNDEYTPNDLTSYKATEIDDGECPGIADCTTPWLEMKQYVDYDYDKLIGDWTATATLKRESDGKSFIHSSKITITDNLNDYPSELPDSVYNIYKEASKYEKEKVDGLWNEFKQMSKDVAKNRLEYQNRLLVLGWLDADSYNRLDTYTPYDLFIDRTYKSVDVSSMFNDFGPKWYLEAVEDGNGNVSLVAPFDSNFLPPSANWSVPFYFAGMELEKKYTVMYGDGFTAAFPVEVSEDWNTITIKPLEYVDGEGNRTEFYPQMLGIDYKMSQTILENVVVSDVVLTKGWSEAEAASAGVQKSARRGSSAVLRPEGDFPKTVYMPMTELQAAPELKKIEGTLMTKEQFKERADKFVEMRYNIKK